jgi:hypothetical protein
VTHGRVITPAESFTVIVPGAGRYVGMTILFPVVYVRGTVVVKVLSRTFNSIVKALALNLAEFSGRGVPSFIAILNET